MNTKNVKSTAPTPTPTTNNTLSHFCMYLYMCETVAPRPGQRIVDDHGLHQLLH